MVQIHNDLLTKSYFNCVRNGCTHPGIIFLTYIIQVQLRKMLNMQIENLDFKKFSHLIQDFNFGNNRLDIAEEKIVNGKVGQIKYSC